MLIAPSKEMLKNGGDAFAFCLGREVRDVGRVRRPSASTSIAGVLLRRREPPQFASCGHMQCSKKS
jgi:hypothetical protein